MEEQGGGPFRSGSDSMAAALSRSTVTGEQAEKYERYVMQAKNEAKMGNLSKSIELFTLANEIHSSEKLKSRIKKLEEALKVVTLDEEDNDDFVDVLNSGLLLYKDLNDKLFAHQKEGIVFLYELYRSNKKGGLLADDMGLGKTIQIIAFLSGMFDAELIKYVLLVMPTTLITNWMKEFVKWTPGMRVSEFHGSSKKERTRNLEKVQRKGGIIITTYQMLINNWEQLSSYNGREFMWDYMILDEAHKIKSSSTKSSKCAHNIPAKYRILLTGTPVQNNLREMWALFDFACKGTLLGTSKTFKMEYENPITRAREKDSTPGEKALGLKISENLMNIIKPYFLRRTKEDIEKNRASSHNRVSVAPSEVSRNVSTPEMPTLTRKNDLIVWVYLAEVQEEIYQKFISLDQIKELLMTTRSPLAELNILKKLCDHPRLLSARACSELGLEGDEGDTYNEIEYTGHTGPTKIDHLSDESLIQESGKLVFLMGLLERLQEEGHRTLVFSQSRKMLDIIDRILKNRGFKVMRIDGTVSHIAERERRINMFQTNTDYSVFLLTTQVGGVGITLTAADRVVIFDPSWNPATDAQAVDRAYRIGQTENVVIYRLITCGTVEEKIYRRQVFKDSLIRQTTGDKKNPFRYFSKQELRELFSLVDAKTSTTQIQLQSLHSAHRKTDTELDEHIACLHTLNIFGISDHDLMYSNETSAHEDQEGDEEEYNYIQHRVQKAQELVTLESHMHGQMVSGTGDSWIHQPVGGPVRKAKRTPASEANKAKPDFSVPNTVDLTSDEDVINVSCQMTSLVIEDSDEEMLEVSISKPDVFITEESQFTEQLNKEQHSSFPPPAAQSRLVNDSHMLDTSAEFVSNKIHCSMSQTKSFNAPSLDRPNPRIEGDKQTVTCGSVITCEIESPTDELKGYSAISGQVQKPMDTRLIMEDHAMLETSDALNSSDKRNKASSKNILPEGIFKSPVEGLVQPSLASGLSCSRQSHEGMLQLPGQFRPIGDSNYEGDSLASQSPFQCDFNLLLEDSVEGEQGTKENSFEYIEKNSNLHLLVESSVVYENNSLVEENQGNRNLNQNDMSKQNPDDNLEMESGEESETEDICVSSRRRFGRINSDSDENSSRPALIDNVTDKNRRVRRIDSASEETSIIDHVSDKKRRVQKIDSESEDDVSLVYDNVSDKKRRVQKIDSESDEENGLFIDNASDKKRHIQRITTDSKEKSGHISAFIEDLNKRESQRIHSESENEKVSLCGYSDGEQAISPFNSPFHSSVKGISASTPKRDRSILGLLFPTRKSMGLNRSTASRRSLVQVAVEDLDDLDETVADSDVEEEMQEADLMVEEEESKVEFNQPKDGQDDHSAPLNSGNSSYLDDEADLPNSPELDRVEDTGDELSEKSLNKSTEMGMLNESTEEGTHEEPTEESAGEESTGDGGLVSGEQIDYCSPEKSFFKEDDIRSNLKNSIAHSEINNTTNSYDTLVQLGKKLKDDGKLKESLNCLLKALDIQSGDPEVMLLTLGLYKQLSNC
ncbi:DNA excision repair protein ERCC-6-like [Lissotriton helveticus]